jgi:hypothetical protein
MNINLIDWRENFYKSRNLKNQNLILLSLSMILILFTVFAVIVKIVLYQVQTDLQLKSVDLQTLKQTSPKNLLNPNPDPSSSSFYRTHLVSLLRFWNFDAASTEIEEINWLPTNFLIKGSSANFNQLQEILSSAALQNLHLEIQTIAREAENKKINFSIIQII